MKNWYINFITSHNRQGIAIVAAPSLRDARIILENQGRYKDEGYKINDATCFSLSCQERRVLQESLSKSNIKTDIPFTKRDMYNDYLYYLEMDNTLDYNYAYTYFKKFKMTSTYGCTSFRKGNFFVRNFDWYYNSQVEFIIKLKPKNKYSTLGVVSYPAITRDIVNDFTNYKILPFFLLDGINEKGVFCNINVVPGNEEGWIKTTGTTPTEELREELCMLMIPRFVLDNFSSAQEAVNYLKEHTSIYAPSTKDMSDYECHFMIGDQSSLYVVEFVNNQLKIIESNNEIITNFRLFGTELNNDGTINYNTVSPFGSGLERFNLIKNNWSSLEENEERLMRFASSNLKYTNSYLHSTSPFWYTEFVGQYSDIKLTVKDAYEHPENFTNIIAIAINRYNTRVRGDNNSWHTLHTSVYNITNKKLYICSQENSNKIHEIAL